MNEGAAQMGSQMPNSGSIRLFAHSVSIPYLSSTHHGNVLESALVDLWWSPSSGQADMSLFSMIQERYYMLLVGIQAEVYG